MGCICRQTSHSTEVIENAAGTSVRFPAVCSCIHPLIVAFAHAFIHTFHVQVSIHQFVCSVFLFIRVTSFIHCDLAFTPCIHSFIHSYINVLIRSVMHACIPSLNHSRGNFKFGCPFIQAFAHSLYPFITHACTHPSRLFESFMSFNSYAHSCTRSYIHSIILCSGVHSLGHSCMHSFALCIHTFIHSLMYRSLVFNIISVFSLSSPTKPTHMQ